MKEIEVKRLLEKLCHIAMESCRCKRLDRSLEAIRASAAIQYQWNQDYTDDALESMLLKIAQTIELAPFQYRSSNPKTVLFYDGFGLDTRGLALIYTKAICDLGYELIYVVPEEARHRQPEIHKVTKDGNIKFCYLKHESGLSKVHEMLKIFSEYQPTKAFFYTTPSDGEACVAFACMKGRVIRYQINLTDHAFWLGINAFDYCLEFREYGACVSRKYRHIPEDKIKMLSFYPFIDKTIPFAGFDFDTSGKRILFSGGSLYKTIDRKETYYHIVSEILRRHEDVIFLYAGSGDDSGLMKLKQDFPHRVMHIKERTDLYALLCHTTLYLNTYPIIGGLMSQYASAAGKPPMTLVDMEDSSLDGLVLNHKQLPLEFSKEADLLAEINDLLNHEEKLNALGEQVKKGILTESEFQESVRSLLEKNEIGFSFELYDIDTCAFRWPYKDRFTNAMFEDAICNWQTKGLWKFFPGLFTHKVLRKIKKKLKNNT